MKAILGIDVKRSKKICEYTSLYKRGKIKKTYKKFTSTVLGGLTGAAETTLFKRGSCLTSNLPIDLFNTISNYPTAYTLCCCQNVPVVSLITFNEATCA